MYALKLLRADFIGMNNKSIIHDSTEEKKVLQCAQRMGTILGKMPLKYPPNHFYSAINMIY